MYNKIVIGIDQSYKNTGITIAADGKVKNIFNFNLEKLKNNTEKRVLIKSKLYDIIKLAKRKSNNVIIIIERIRLSSQGFININYIKSIGALNACIVDTAKSLCIDVFSVDTRSWKAQVIGSSKGQNNAFGVDPKKWPTIQYVVNLGFKEKIIHEVGAKKNKGVFEEGGKRYIFDDDAADSVGIALYGFLPRKEQKLQEEH